MAFTNRDDLAEAMKSLRVHGKGTDKYDNVRVGLNARLDTLQAAIVLAKFGVFPEELVARQRLAAEYGALLGKLPAGRVEIPTVPQARTSAWAQYTIRCAQGRREALQRALQKSGVPTAVYYPLPLHLQGAFRGLGYTPEDFPVSEAASRGVMSLPFGPYLKETEVASVVEALSHCE
jgi:UDP-2-acetamido-2-deoxy-ribo-hexuluronate aminotransferase